MRISKLTTQALFCLALIIIAVTGLGALTENYTSAQTGQYQTETSDSRNKDYTALDNLSTGLDDYLHHRYERAKQKLRKARQSQYALSVAGRFMLVDLDTIIETCETQTSKEVCDRCGGTGMADCSRCLGSGYMPCPHCHGKGKIRKKGTSRTRSPRYETCPACSGCGIVKCIRCGGKGVVSCPKCRNLESTKNVSLAGPRTRKSIEKTILLAQYLSSGGLDLYTAEALTPVSE